jgi:hypothetical protein
MKILVKQIKTGLEEFVINLEGSPEEKKRMWREAMGSIGRSMRAYRIEYKDRRKDVDIFDYAWTRCDVTEKDLAIKFETTEGAVKQSLWRVRNYIKKELQFIG